VRSAGYWAGATLAFLAELGSLAALAFWGFTVPSGAQRVLLGVGLPVAAAVLWGLFAAPRAVVRVTALVVVTKVAVQGGAVTALAVVGRPALAGVLAGAAVLGQALTSAFPPAAGAPTRSRPGSRRAGGPPTG
jgi:Protein of unknown function (DUF2568)